MTPDNSGLWLVKDAWIAFLSPLRGFGRFFVGYPGLRPRPPRRTRTSSGANILLPLRGALPLARPLGGTGGNLGCGLELRNEGRGLWLTQVPKCEAPGATSLVIWNAATRPGLPALPGAQMRGIATPRTRTCSWGPRTGGNRSWGRECREAIAHHRGLRGSRSRRT
jgi:hypothetical protein